MDIFNEDSRVKIPGLLHFLRLGYTYQSKKGQNIQKHNNIFIDIFKKSMKEINGREYSEEQIWDTIKEIETLTNKGIIANITEFRNCIFCITDG